MNTGLLGVFHLVADNQKYELTALRLEWFPHLVIWNPILSLSKTGVTYSRRRIFNFTCIISGPLREGQRVVALRNRTPLTSGLCSPWTHVAPPCFYDRCDAGKARA